MAMTEKQNEVVEALKRQGYTVIVPSGGPVPVGGPISMKSSDGKLWAVIWPDGSIKEVGK